MDQSDFLVKNNYHKHLHQLHPPSQLQNLSLENLVSSVELYNNNQEPLTSHDMQRLKKV
ncbi:10291_t:CDS:1, partial [Cetraspora pellucida]